MPGFAIRQAVRDQFAEHIRRGRWHHVLDLRKLGGLDTTTLGALVLVHRILREVGGTVRLVTDNASARDVLALTALDKIFCVYQTPEAAAMAFEQAQGLSA